MTSVADIIAYFEYVANKVPGEGRCLYSLQLIRNVAWADEGTRELAERMLAPGANGHYGRYALRTTLSDYAAEAFRLDIREMDADSMLRQLARK